MIVGSGIQLAADALAKAASLVLHDSTEERLHNLAAAVGRYDRFSGRVSGHPDDDDLVRLDAAIEEVLPPAPPRAV